MIKTEYRGWQLRRITFREYVSHDERWVAVYTHPKNFQVTGTGHTPEAALASAQKKVCQIAQA